MAIEKNNPEDQIDIQIEPDSAREIQQPLMEGDAMILDDGSAIVNPAEDTSEQGAFNANLAELITEDELESLAPVTLQINVFRFIGNNQIRVRDIEELNKFNDKIIIECQNSGIAVPSSTIIKGTLAIRINLTNHRTTTQDLDILIETIIQIGRKEFTNYT